MDYPHSKQGQIVYPKNTLEVAKIIGEGRWMKNSMTRKANPHYDQGSEEENKKVDIRGVFAELIAQHFFDTNRIRYDSAPLLAEKKQTGSDIVLLDGDEKPLHFIDVKSVKKGTSNFNVNCVKVHKNQIIDIYFFVQPSMGYASNKCVADYYVVGVEDIKKWKVERAETKKAYFSRKITDQFELVL